MSTPDTTGSNGSARDAPLSHLPDHIRRAIEITPAAGTRERIIDITTLGRRTGRPHRIEIFFYRAAGDWGVVAVRSDNLLPPQRAWLVVTGQREYEELNRRLATEHGHDREAYTRGKAEFVERVLS